MTPREIKFRVFTDHGYIYCSAESVEKLSFYKDKIGIKFIDGKKQFEPLDRVEQFTGIKDKKEKDIYEGDIVEYPSSDFFQDYIEIGDIRWWKDRWGICIESTQHCYNLGDRPSSITVLGNVRENPELIS